MLHNSIPLCYKIAHLLICAAIKEESVDKSVERRGAADHLTETPA